MNNLYAIKTSIGLVAGLNRQMQMIDVTDSRQYVKTFKTEKAATKYAEKYANAGYGLTTYSIIPIE